MLDSALIFPKGKLRHGLDRVEGPLCFVHVALSSDPSEFQSDLR